MSANAIGKLSLGLLLSLALALPLAGHAAKKVEDVESSPIPAGLSMKQIFGAIVDGGKTRGWIVKEIGPGHARATIFVRSHMAKVDIRFDSSSYSIRYHSSDNLGYKDGKIHRNYNKWVANLNMDIQRALAML